MHKNETRKHHSHHRHNNFDLYADLERIKNAFAHTASDVKGKTGDFFIQSVDGIKEKSSEIRDNVADYTADRPFKSLGVAMLIGIAVGYLLKK